MVGTAKLYLPDARSIRQRRVQRIRFIKRIIVQRIREPKVSVAKTTDKRDNSHSNLKQQLSCTD
jgi:hypothetical protein